MFIYIMYDSKILYLWPYVTFYINFQNLLNPKDDPEQSIKIICSKYERPPKWLILGEIIHHLVTASSATKDIEFRIFDVNAALMKNEPT